MTFSPRASPTPKLFIATANAAGTCDCSFRADTSGFVHALNENSLACPDIVATAPLRV